MKALINNIHLGDARVLGKDVEGNSVDLIFTDPPYAAEYLDLYSWLGEFAARVLKDSGFVLAYCGNMHLDKVIFRMSESLEFFFPYVELAHGNSTILWPRKTVARYKPIVAFRKKGTDAMPKTNVLAVWGMKGGGDKRFHKWGQTEHTARYFLDVFPPKRGLIVDPFLGGGTTAVVAKRMGLRYIGFEIEKAYFEVAKTRLDKDDHQPELLPTIPTQDEIEGWG